MTAIVDFTAVRTRRLAGLPAFDNAGLPMWKPQERVLSIAGWSLNAHCCFKWGDAWRHGHIRRLVAATADRPSQAHICGVSDAVIYVVPVRDLREWEGQKL